MTPELMAEYFAAIEATGITPQRLGERLEILDAYADVMIADGEATIADAQGEAAKQEAETIRQAAQAKAATARGKYLALIQAKATRAQQGG